MSIGTGPIGRVTWVCYGPEIWYISCSTKEGRNSSGRPAVCCVERLCFVCSIPFSTYWYVGVHGVGYWPGGSYLLVCWWPWDILFALSTEAQHEIYFWIDNFDNGGYPIWSPSPKIDVMTYSDASSTGWGGYAVQIGEQSAISCWSETEVHKSSTWREIRATRLVLQSLIPSLQGREVRHRTDNMNTVHILSVGSRKQDLHLEAVEIYKLCQKNGIRLSVEWVSRDDNEQADTLSRAEDANDYSLDPLVFQRLDEEWGPHTVDRFASVHTKQLPRYCSRFLNPGCEAVDAFTVSWR